jgi:lauroyl/myristoyl acyltransferase
MRFFVIRVYLAWCNALRYLAQQLASIGRAGNVVVCKMLHYLPYRVVLALFHAAYCLPWVGRRLKCRAMVARANKQALLGMREQRDFTRLTLRRKLLELAATWAQNRRVLADIAQCRAELNAVVAPLHQAGSPVILAPLHMVSDILAGMVGAGVTPGKTTVIVSSSVEAYQQQVRQLGGIDLDYCSIHDDNRDIAGNLMDAIMEAVELKRNIMIFPDITPDYTVNTNPANTSKLPCQLFGRAAHLHSGILRVARMLSAQVVFYHLYEEGGLKLRIFEPVSARNLKKMLPEVIETAICQHADDWMLWHAHSLFFINE